jgi:hypothetical protein
VKLNAPALGMKRTRCSQKQFELTFLREMRDNKFLHAHVFRIVKICDAC